MHRGWFILLLTKEICEALQKEFPESSLSCKVQSYGGAPKGQKANASNATCALMVAYLSHTDVARRLDEVCNTYDLDWEFTETRPVFGATTTAKDDNAPPYVCEGRLTIWGRIQGQTFSISRVGVGEGNSPKEAYSDALKRAAVLFGVGRYLYDQEQIWIDWESDYYYKKFTFAEVKDMAGERRKRMIRNKSSRSDSKLAQQSSAKTQKTLERLESEGKQVNQLDDTKKKLTVTKLAVLLGPGASDESKKAIIAEFGQPITTPADQDRLNKWLDEKIAEKRK
jgi:hypothetical protein